MAGTPRAARRDWGQAIAGLTIVGVFAALVYCRWERDRHLIAEPVAITPAELRAAESSPRLPTPFVTLPVERQLETGVRLERRAYVVKSIQCDYVVIPVADKWMIAEVPAGFQGKVLTGYVAPWTSGVQAEALRLIHGKIDRESLDKLLPFQLEAGYDLHHESRWMLSIGAGMIALGLLWALYWTCKRPARPNVFAEYQQFAPAGGWPRRRMPAR